jgi:hypothetical protein
VYVLEKFLGGSLLSVVFRLAFLSLIVGAALAFVDLSPFELAHRFWRFVQRIFELGYSAIGEIGQWVVSGLIIVVPLFVVIRFWKMRR